MPRTLEQRYAEAAFRRVEAAAKKFERPDDFDTYKARADSFPTFVMQAGLAQAVGFLLAKGPEKKPYQQYLNDLSSVLGRGSGEDFHREVIAAELAEYRLLTRQALAAAGWLKRMTQAKKVAQSKSGGKDS